jgi:transcription initiation factor TFIIB
MKKEGGYTVRIGVGDFKEVEKPILSVDKEIFRQASLLDLDDDIMHEVQAMYEDVRRNGLTKYKQEEKVVTALIYVVCRKKMIPLTLHKICDILRIEYRSINKVYRYLVKRMSMHIPASTPGEYLHKFGVEMHLSKTVMKKAERILDAVTKKGLISGKGPAGVAAASICLASELEKRETSPKDIADISGVTQVTIRNRYKELEVCLNGRLKAIAAA